MKHFFILDRICQIASAGNVQASLFSGNSSVKTAKSFYKCRFLLFVLKSAEDKGKNYI